MRMILSLFYGWINRLKEKLHNLSEFTGIRSGNNKWTQMSLTSKCRRPSVTKQWTQTIRKCHHLRGHLPSSSLTAGGPFRVHVGQVHSGRAQSLSKHKALSYFLGNWCLPRNGLAQLWVWIFWNISPVNAASGTPADNMRVSSLGPRDNVFQPMKNLRAGKL